ncbi:MAG: hypothetical protein ACR2KJ_08985 [Jatrophihabitans sp.]
MTAPKIPLKLVGMPFGLAGLGETWLTLVDFLVLTVLLGGWFTGQWIYAPVDLDRFHPGYFLPTVAGGLIAAAAAATVGQHRLAEVMLGLGTVCWLVLGSIILGRLLFRPLLPPPLQPTLAIEVAPAAVASLAWFALHGDAIDLVSSFVAGYGLLMVIAQLRLLPAYPTSVVHAQHVGLHLQLGRRRHRRPHLAAGHPRARLPDLAVPRPRRDLRPHATGTHPSPAASAHTESDFGSTRGRRL